MDDDSRFSYFFLGLGLGVAAGLLLAPKSGSETRDLIVTKANESGEYLKRRSSGLKDSASELIDKGKEQVVRQKEHFAQAVEAGRQAYRDSVAGAGRPVSS